MLYVLGKGMMLVMTDETMMILKKLDEMSQEIREVKDVAIKARDVAAEARDVAIEARDVALKAEKAALRTQMTLEIDISQKIDLIGEGHDFLNGKLEEALQMERKREIMELELISHRMDIKRIKEYLSIA